MAATVVLTVTPIDDALQVTNRAGEIVMSERETETPAAELKHNIAAILNKKDGAIKLVSPDGLQFVAGKDSIPRQLARVDAKKRRGEARAEARAEKEEAKRRKKAAHTRDAPDALAEPSRMSGTPAPAQPQEATGKQTLLLEARHRVFQDLPAVPFFRLAQCCTQLREASRCAQKRGRAIELHMRSLCQALPPAVASRDNVPSITEAYRAAHAATCQRLWQIVVATSAHGGAISAAASRAMLESLAGMLDKLRGERHLGSIDINTEIKAVVQPLDQLRLGRCTGAVFTLEDFAVVRDSLAKLIASWWHSHQYYMMDGPWAFFQIDLDAIIAALRLLTEVARKHCPHDEACRLLLSFLARQTMADWPLEGRRWRARLRAFTRATRELLESLLAARRAADGTEQRGGGSCELAAYIRERLSGGAAEVLQ